MPMCYSFYKMTSYDDLPPLSPKFLRIIKWIPDGGSTKKKLKICESIAPKWRDVADMIGIENAEIVSIQNPGSGKTPQQCLREVFGKWQENGDADADYPYNWEGLVSLLVDIEHKVLADSLNNALASQRSTVQGNLHHLIYNEDRNRGFVTWFFGIVMAVVALVIVFIIAYRNELIHGYKVRTCSKTIPHLSNNFVGRENELQEIMERLNFDFTETRIVSIVGSPGFGKSTLAIHIAHALIDQGIQVHYVNVNDFPDSDVELVLAEKILKSSDITAKTITFDRLLQWVEDRNGYILLVLDNCDNVLHTQKDRFQNVILKIVQASTTIKVIMTSREIALQIEYYSWYKVYELSSKAAISLLNQKFPKMNILLETKEEIAKLTGNVPLALHIVGSLLTLEDPPSPETVINELKLNPMSLLSPEALPIEQRINASISLSYGYLSENLKNVAHFLALFTGSFNKDAAIDISQNYKNVDGSILQLSHSELRMLVDRSLLEYNDRAKRYQYHRLIREYLLAINDEFQQRIYRKNFYSGFRNYFLNLLNENAINFNQHYVDSLQFLDTERHNIYDLLQILNTPDSVPRRLLLDVVDLVTLAIDNGYLTCRYSHPELISLLEETVLFLDDHIQNFRSRAKDKHETDKKVFYERIYAKLVITFSKMLAFAYGDQHAISFMEERQSIMDSLEEPAQPTGNVDPAINPSEVQTSVKAQRHVFYIRLANHYLNIGQHSKVIACQFKIIKSAKKCSKENYCSYREVGFMYSSIKEDTKAIDFLEYSLRYEENGVVSKVNILLKLSELYKRIQSEEERKTISQLIDSCHTMMQMKDRVIFNHWETILKAITVINQAGLDGQFFEERLFSIVSNLGTDIQLQPKDAVKMLAAIENFNNHTKTILWGTVILKPFQKYNFSVQIFDVLKINASISLARLKNWEFSEGLDGLEYIINAINESASEVVEAKELYEIICPPLILRPKHIYPCYKNSINNFFNTIFYSVPITLGNLLFAVPLGFYNIDQKFTDKAQYSRKLKSSELITTSSQLQIVIEDISVIGINAFNSMWYNHSDNITWVYIKLNNLARFLLNVSLVFVRLWILTTILLPASMSFFILFSSLLLNDILAPRYFAIILNPESLTLTRYCVIWTCYIIISFQLMFGKYLQNIFMYPWLLVFVHVTNFTQSNSFEYVHSLFEGYKGTCVIVILQFLISYFLVLGFIGLSLLAVFVFFFIVVIYFLYSIYYTYIV